MYQTSDNYKAKIYQPSTKHLLKIYINDIEINSKYILDCKFSQTLFDNGELTLGSVSSQAAELKLYKEAVPETIDKVYIESGIAEEINPIGYFNLEDITKNDDYSVTLKLLDYMIKFEANYEASKLNYPCKLINILQDICLKVGVELRFYLFFKCEL